MVEVVMGGWHEREKKRWWVVMEIEEEVVVVCYGRIGIGERKRRWKS